MLRACCKTFILLSCRMSREIADGKGTNACMSVWPKIRCKQDHKQTFHAGSHRSLLKLKEE